MQKKKTPKKPPAREKSLFLHRTAFFVLQWGKRVGRPERPFYFPTFLFPTQFFPHAVSLTAHVRWVWNTASDFFLQFLSTRVFAFWQLAAGQPHWTLIQLSWIELFQIELNFFLNELNFFHPWRIAKESNQTTKKPIKKERWKTKQKKERSGFSINT